MRSASASSACCFAGENAVARYDLKSLGSFWAPKAAAKKLGADAGEQRGIAGRRAANQGIGHRFLAARTAVTKFPCAHISTVPKKGMKVGDLAKRTGLSIRTFIGLPHERYEPLRPRLIGGILVWKEVQHDLLFPADARSGTRRWQERRWRSRTRSLSAPCRMRRLASRCRSDGARTRTDRSSRARDAP